MEGRQGAPVFAHGGFKGGVGAQRSIGTDAIDVAALDLRRCVWHECCVPPVHILCSFFNVSCCTLDRCHVRGDASDAAALYVRGCIVRAVCDVSCCGAWCTTAMQIVDVGVFRLMSSAEQPLEPLVDKFEQLANEAIRVLKAQPTLCQVQLPCKVFGDIHGQFRDLLILFRQCVVFGSSSIIVVPSTAPSDQFLACSDAKTLLTPRVHAHRWAGQVWLSQPSFRRRGRGLVCLQRRLCRPRVPPSTVFHNAQELTKM